ncbi:MAG: endonuclease domain-containing protein [Candidatus Buchananbacteria bacterium]
MKKIFNQKSNKAKRKKLRNEMTRAEQILWYYLRRHQLKGYKFRRQQGVNRYIVDFYCPKVKLAIEIDGDTHFGQKAIKYDLERQGRIEEFGIKFLRFTNLDVYENIDSVLAEIADNLP